MFSYCEQKTEINQPFKITAGFSLTRILTRCETKSAHGN